MKKEILKKMNKYLSDSAVMYIKLHNFHWNINGMQFKGVHEYLEVLYDTFTANLDEIAELIRMNGEYPAASMKEYLELSTIKELPSVKVGIKEAMEVVLEDLKTLDNEAKELREMAQKEDAFDVATMMEAHCANYLKTMWFVTSMVD